MLQVAKSCHHYILPWVSVAFTAEVAEGADGAEAETANEASAELKEAPEESPKAEARRCAMGI